MTTKRRVMFLLVALVGPIALAHADAPPAAQKLPETRPAVEDHTLKSIAEITYDEKKGKSNIGFSGLEVFRQGAVSIVLNLGCSYKGRIPSDPGQCFVSLTSRSPGEQYPEHSTAFNALADGAVVIVVRHPDLKRVLRGAVCSKTSLTC